MQKRISVRNLVETILRSGSIDSGYTGRNRLEEGARAHRKLQKTEGYDAEVFLSITETRADIEFTVEGRADGIIINENGVTVDEIKSTLTPLEYIGEDYSQIHWAQAMCYGHIYCAKNGLEQIDVRLTYYEIDADEIKRFVRTYPADELRLFFTRLLEKYAVWAHFEADWKEKSTASMRALVFPFETYREGQRNMAAAVYRTIAAEGRLFAMAPTGVGKTISALFPAMKAMGEYRGEKVFYLTAKTVARQAAQAALDKMREFGLTVKSVVITAKDKACLLEERVCKPTHCKYADSHFDRVNDAIMDALRSCDSFTAEKVAEYAERHQVCPYELSLDIALLCDVIICDYNYLFDPQVYLRRFFADGGDYIFLIDEAHNLADRAREMFSASVSKRELLAAKKTLSGGKPGNTNDKAEADDASDPFNPDSVVADGYARQRTPLTGILGRTNKLLLDEKRKNEGKDVRIEKEQSTGLCDLLETFATEFEKWLGENPDPDQELLETYFGVLTYLKIAELYDERYSMIYETGAGGDFTVKQFCADPSHLLDESLSLGRAVVLFSATLTPPGYFLETLGGGENSKYIAIPSPFPRVNLLLLVADDISTKYKDREESLERVADMIYSTAAGKTGNYIAYFPSYRYLEGVYSLFVEKYADVKTVRQEQGMAENERDEFLALFEGGGETMIAFCVLGGIFSEGIDLTGDRLIGTVIVGVGLPQINTQLDIVREHWGRQGDGSRVLPRNTQEPSSYLLSSRGYDYAYRIPGMNKVLQAAGRVIRSGDDRGVVLLIDSRFTSRQYTELFPEHWRHWRTVRGVGELTKALDAFWM